jgi:hypothetical protein
VSLARPPPSPKSPFPSGTGLAIVSRLLRGGFPLSPPPVGFVADLASLRIGLLSVVLAGVITIVLARVLDNRTPARTSRAQVRHQQNTPMFIMQPITSHSGG